MKKIILFTSEVNSNFKNPDFITILTQVKYQNHDFTEELRQLDEDLKMFESSHSKDEELLKQRRDLIQMIIDSKERCLNSN